MVSYFLSSCLKIYPYFFQSRSGDKISSLMFANAGKAGMMIFFANYCKSQV